MTLTWIILSFGLHHQLEFLQELFSASCTKKISNSWWAIENFSINLPTILEVAITHWIVLEVNLLTQNLWHFWRLQMWFKTCSLFGMSTCIWREHSTLRSLLGLSACVGPSLIHWFLEPYTLKTLDIAFF